MVQNKFDAMLSLLSNNPVMYKQFVEAVEAEAEEARKQLQTAAVNALYNADEVPHACGCGGVYQAWSDILVRARRAQH